MISPANQIPRGFISFSVKRFIMFEQVYDQRQIGAAQNFSMQLAQVLQHLSPVAGQYASYYEMRLDFLLNSRENLESRLERLFSETSDPLLKARTGILLGQMWLTRYEWKKSADILTSSLAELKKLRAWRYSARAMLSLGDVYVDLVENGGGMQPENFTDSGKLSRFLTRLLFLPYLLLDWLRRKIWFLPGWLYFGGNYQDWIMNYLLEMAGNWYRKAWLMAQRVADDTVSLNALLGQANVAVQQRREAKAQRIYSRLVLLPAVQSSRYRLAQISYGLGQVSLLADHGAQASRELQNALDTFRSFADEENVALVAQALGKTYLLLGDDESATKAWLESFQAYGEIRDPLSQTKVAWELEQLLENKQTTGSMEQPVKAALATIQEKQYLARFPSDLLRRFRTLAYWVALPLSYLLILFVGMAVSISLIAIEYSALQISTTGRLSQFDIFWLIAVGVLPIFLTFWIIELVYAMIGQGWVFVAGRTSLNTLGEQPDRIVLSSDGLALNRPGLDEPIKLAWNEIQRLISADYRIWQRPIYLLSRQGSISGRRSMVIDGITSGYTQIGREIAKKAGGIVSKLNADMVILAHRSTYVAVLIAIFHAQWLVSAGQIDITVENENAGEVHLFLSRLLVFFLVNIITIFPPLMLWRIYFQRRFFGQQIGSHPTGYSDFILRGAAILLSVVAILWLVFSPFL
jgi:tetratricopeptide (TPR) repeat protein